MTTCDPVAGREPVGGRASHNALIVQSERTSDAISRTNTTTPDGGRDVIPDRSRSEIVQVIVLNPAGHGTAELGRSENGGVYLRRAGGPWLEVVG